MLTSFIHLDKCSETHPPPRLRVRLMLRMLKRDYSVEGWHKELKSFCSDWDEVSAGQIPGGNPFDQLALETIGDAALDMICEAGHSATRDINCYTTEQFDEDVAELAPLLLCHIPPGERPPKRDSVPLASVINAGWHVYLCEFEAFRKSLHAKDGETRFTAATKLHELVLKALEISGIRTSWEEACRDLKR